MAPLQAHILQKVPDKVRQNIGLCLFSQAGVAIGLAISLDIEFAQFGSDAQLLARSDAL